MNKHLFTFSIAIIFVITLTGGCPHKAVQGQQLRADDNREAKSIAKKFAVRLQEEKDIAPLVNQFFVEDFLARFEKEPGGFPLAFFKRGAASQVSREDRLRYYNLSINFYYLSQLYLSGKVFLGSGRSSDNLKPEELLPPGVYELLVSNPQIAKSIDKDTTEDLQIESSEELRSMLPTLEQAVTMMREYLKAHPVEQTGLYKKNLDRLKNRSDLMKPWLSACDEKCFGFPEGTHLIRINIPFLQLLLVREQGSLKILSVAPYSK